MGRSTRRPTVLEAWKETERRFIKARLHYGHGTHNARDEAAWLVCHVLRLAFDDLALNLDRPLTEAQEVRLGKIAGERIATRAPLAYLIREAWLGDHRFYVDRRVIVPRSFIAELLPGGLAPWLGRRSPAAILDMCTGSGCLAILAALAFPKSEVDAVDISPAALAVARRNVVDYRLGTRVRLVHSDLFGALSGRRYDLILSNPPYVKAASMRRLPDEYRHEPERALAGGSDGLDLVRQIVAHAADHLSPSGILVLEIGHNRAAMERAYPRLPLVWLETSAGDEYVCLLRGKDLPRP